MYAIYRENQEIQYFVAEVLYRTSRSNFDLSSPVNGSNTDDSFTLAVSNSFLSPLETAPIAADLG